MVTQVLVLVADRDDPNHTEVTVLDKRADAERLFQTLLEAGIEQQRIRIFSGTELHAQVTHKPVVALDVGDTDESARESDVPPVEEEIEHEEAGHEAQAVDEATEAFKAANDNPLKTTTENRFETDKENPYPA
jgi:DNA-binding LacI/PurR family transcriptional regulator